MRLFGWQWLKMAPEGDGGTGAAGATAAAAAPAAGTTTTQATTTTAAAPVAGAAGTTQAATVAQPAAQQQPAQPAASAALSDENARLNAELKAALAAAQRFTADELAKKRREIVRSGMSVQMSDADLDLMLPKVDPRTPEGETALGAWRQARQDWYPAAVEAPRATSEDMAAKLPERLKTSSIFGPDALRHAHASMNARGGSMNARGGR